MFQTQVRVRICKHIAAVIVLLGVLMNANNALAQAFGVELQNTVMPASGAMGGASIAQPQDLLSAINGNPATLSQFRGTQFSFGGVWDEPTVNLEHTGNLILPGVGPFAGKSGTPGVAPVNIGVTQDFTVMGRPVTMGAALVTTAGLGVDYSAQPNSNYSSVTLQVLTFQPGIGVQLTDRLSAGANFGLGIGLFDGLFVGNSKATNAYGARGTVGMNFDVNACTKIGAYYQSKQSYTFENAIIVQPFAGLPGLPLDVPLDLPPNVAIGISNSSLANGRLLLAADFVYKFWQEATLFDAIYENQFCVQLGATVHGQPSQASIGIRLGRKSNGRRSRKCYWRHYPARSGQRTSVHRGIGAQHKRTPNLRRYRRAKFAARYRFGSVCWRNV